MRRLIRRIVAGLGYALGALLLLSGLAGGIPASVVFGLTIVLLTILATNVGGLRRRLPLFNSPNRIKALGAWIGLVLAGLVTAVIASPSPPTTQRAGLAPTSAPSPTAIAAVQTATVAPATPAPTVLPPTVTTVPATSTAEPTAVPTAPPSVEPTQPPPPAANTAPPATTKPAPPAPTPTSAPTAQPKPTQPPPPKPAPTAAPVAKPAAKVDAAAAAISAGHGIAPQNRACPESHQIKGNAEGRQAGRAEDPTYHVRGRSRTYNQTVPEVCFATTDAARQAGFRPVQ